jgi:SAM-dependent methyltransferase
MEWSDGYVVEAEYVSNFYRDLSPRILELATLSQNIDSPATETPFTYMELGCGQGVTTNLNAACTPQATFFAADFNPMHIRNAQGLAQSAGLANMTFLERSFKELRDDYLPDFDFITFHGVYSWISHENRMEIVDFIRRKLKPGGLVYVSYNCLPGWTAFAPVRHLMAEYAAYAPHSPEGPTGVMREAIAFAQKVKSIDAAFFKQNTDAGRKLDDVAKAPPNYLVHEYLNRDWSLAYHAEVVRTFQEAKLTYVGSSTIMDNMLDLTLTDKARELVAGIGDVLFRETVTDFIRNRGFRRDIFIRGGSRISPPVLSERIGRMRFALTVPRNLCKLEVKVPRGSVSFLDKIWNPIFDALAETPKTVQELSQIPELSEVPFPVLCRSIIAGVAVGYLWPAAPSSQVEQTLVPITDRMNAALLDRATKGQNAACLASPTLGTGIAISPVDMVFFSGIRSGAADLAAYVWDWLQARGQTVVVKGKPCESKDEGLAQLAKEVDRIVNSRVPALNKMGITFAGKSPSPGNVST